LCEEKKREQKEEIEIKEMKKREEEEKAKEEYIRKAREENERKEYQEREKLRQEQEFERQSKVVEFKRNSKAKREIRIRELVFHPSTLPSMKTQFPKGVIPSLNSSFSIPSFVLFPSQPFFHPSHSIILHYSTYFANTHFDFKIIFKTHLSQSVRHSFCEVGRISQFFKFKSPSSHIFYQYLLHGLYDFTTIMFDDYCRYIFYPLQQKSL